MRMDEVFSKDFVKGFKTCLKMCQDIAKRQGYEIVFPDLDDLKVAKGK